MMKRKILLFLIGAFLTGNLAFGQITFELTYNESSVDIGTSVIETDGGYIMCGTTMDDSNGDLDVFVTKVDFDGNVIWTNLYSDIGVGDDYATYITGTSDGYYLITGTTEDVVNGDDDVFVLKISDSGNELWVEDYDGGLEDDDGANYIIESDDGGYYICGNSFDGDFSDMWLFEITTSGSFVGENFYGFGDDDANCVVELDDGSVIIVGSSYDDANGDMDGVLIKTDVNGNEEWAYYTTGLADEEFNDVIIDEDGDYLIVGNQEDEVNGDLDILLEIISFDGSTVYYSHTFDYNGGDDHAYRVYVNPSNECFIVGEVEDTDDTDAYIASVDVASGNITGEVLYGNEFDDVFFDFDFTSDNGFICVGATEVNANGDSDVYLVKTDENGQVTGIETFTAKSNIAIYPNPVIDVLNIKTTNTDLIEYTIENISGQQVQSGKYKSSINVTTLKKGIYFIKMSSKNKTVTRKFLKTN